MSTWKPQWKHDIQLQQVRRVNIASFISIFTKYDTIYNQRLWEQKRSQTGRSTDQLNHLY